MKIIKGTLKNLKIVKTSANDDVNKLVFSLDNKIVQLDTYKSISAKNGDEVIVAGVVGENKIFTAYSYKKIS